MANIPFLNNAYFSSKVGIGTDSPDTLLDVSSANYGATAPTIRITNTLNVGDWSGVTSDLGRFEFFTDDTSGNAPYTLGYIAIKNDYITGTPTLPSGAMIFATTTYNTTGGAVERMRIDSVGNVGIGTTNPTSKLHIVQTVTDPSLDQPNSFAQHIDSNHSGSTATGGDREQGGLFIDVDSSTTGGTTTDEHRLYGLRTDVRHSGDADLATGASFFVEQNTATGVTTNIYGITSSAASDGGAGATLTNIAGVNSSVSVQDATPIGNSYAGNFLNLSTSSRTALTSNSYGVRSEIQIDSTSSFTNLYAGHFSIDSNAAYTATNSYLLYLDYAGASLANNIYSIYSPDDVKSYHEGNFGIGTSTPNTKLNVEGARNVAILTLSSTTNDSSWTVGDKIGGIDFNSADTSGAGAGVKASISYEVSVGTTGSTNAMVFRAAGTAAGTNNTEVMRLDQFGNVVAAGSVKIGDDSAAASATNVGAQRYRTGTEYVEVTGADLITNGDFATDSSWAKGTGWTISGGTANAVSGSGSNLSQNGILTVGSYYKMRFTISNYSAGAVETSAGALLRCSFNSNGIHECIHVCGPNTNFYFIKNGSFVGSVDNVSVIEVEEQDASYVDMCMQTGTSTYEWVNITQNNW